MSGAWGLYEDCRAWSAAVERRAKKRQLLLGRIQKYPLPARLGISALYEAFAAVRFRIEVEFERLGRGLSQRGKHHAFQKLGQGQVLRQDHLQDIVRRHSNLSCSVERAGDDAEPGPGETSAPVEPGVECRAEADEGLAAASQDLIDVMAWLICRASELEALAEVRDRLLDLGDVAGQLFRVDVEWVAGAAGQLRASLQLTQAGRDLAAALGARDVDLLVVKEALGHLDLSCLVLQPGDDAESGPGETSAPVEPQCAPGAVPESLVGRVIHEREWLGHGCRSVDMGGADGGARQEGRVGPEGGAS